MKNLTKRKYSGIRQKHVNEIVWNLYGYKFFKNENCMATLENFMSDDLSIYSDTFDYIIPIKPRNSGSNIVGRMAEYISNILNCNVLDILHPGNASATKRDLRGLKILLVDDVITTGRTAAKAAKALEKLGARNIQFYALAKATEK